MIIAACAFACALVMLLVAVLVHVDQHIFRERAERLRNDIVGITPRQTTLDSEKTMLSSWTDSVTRSTPCDNNFCDIHIVGPLLAACSPTRCRRCWWRACPARPAHLQIFGREAGERGWTNLRAQRICVGHVVHAHFVCVCETGRRALAGRLLHRRDSEGIRCRGAITGVWMSIRIRRAGQSTGSGSRRIRARSASRCRWIFRRTRRVRRWSG